MQENRTQVICISGAIHPTPQKLNIIFQMLITNSLYRREIIKDDRNRLKKTSPCGRVLANKRDFQTSREEADEWKQAKREAWEGEKRQASPIVLCP